MKNFKLMMVLLLALGVTVVSCSKDDDDDNNNNPSSSFKGSASLTVDGTQYDVLASDVVEMDEGVTFFLEDGEGDIFQAAIANVPAIGETVQLSLDGEDDATSFMLADGPIPNIMALIAGSGTVKRTSENNYEVDATLFGGVQFAEEYTVSGTIEVGVNGR